MTSIKPRNIVVIGQGKVGQSLGNLFKLRGHTLTELNREYKEHFVKVAGADIVLICVNDDVIEEVCQILASELKAGAIVAHCSGALDSSVLVSAQQSDCFVASCHPLNTFPNLEASLTKFASTDHTSYLYAEGDREALEELLPMFEDTGFITQEIESAAKPLYHAACVFACNYLTSLMDMSIETARIAGLDEKQFWKSLQPLIQSTLNNIANGDTAAALSGPIARGDFQTVKKHINVLEQESKSLTSNYASLGIRALEIAQRNGELKEDELSKLKKILGKPN